MFFENTIEYCALFTGIIHVPHFVSISSAAFIVAINVTNSIVVLVVAAAVNSIQPLQPSSWCLPHEFDVAARNSVYFCCERNPFSVFRKLCWPLGSVSLFMVINILNLLLLLPWYMVGFAFNGLDRVGWLVLC